LPHEQYADSPVLMEDEKRELTACEQAIDHLRLAFWAAGKALAVIRDRRLYRTTHTTFEDYLKERWEMSRAQAYRLIEAWPLAEQIGLSPVGDTTLSESHVRALLPVARRHGEETAAEVYRAVIEADGVRVTAQLLAEVADALPDDGAFDPAEAAGQIRAFLAGRDGQENQSEAGKTTPSAVDELAAEVARVRAILQRLEQRGTVRRAAAEDAEAARRLLEPLRSWPKALDSSQG
jgi:hypothetical protein